MKLPNVINELKSPKEVENFIKESYFDNNYQAFIAWWDSNVVPITEEFNTLYQETRNESM